MSIFTEKLVRALLIFDSFHLLTMEMFGDQIGFWSLGKVKRLSLDLLIWLNNFYNILTFNSNLILSTFWLLENNSYFWSKVEIKNSFVKEA